MVQITVGTTPTQAAPMNAHRLGVTFFNNSTGGQAIHIQKYGTTGLTITNSEYILPQGTGLSFLLAFDGPDVRNEWGAVATLAGAVLVVGETAERDGEK